MIKYIKNKILNSLESNVKKQMIQDIKEQVLHELESMSVYKVNLKEYKIKTAKESEKMSVWNIMKILPIEEVQIESKFQYDNGIEDKKTQTFKTIQELNTFCDEFNDSVFSNSNISGFTEIKLYVWYYYKSKDRKLVVEYFINGSELYRNTSYTQVVKTIHKFLKDHPELLI